MDLSDEVEALMLSPSSYPFGEPPYCTNSFVDSLCILRHCNREYQRVTGISPTNDLPAELATARVTNQVAFLARTVRVPGHYKDDHLVCMPLTKCDSIVSLLWTREESLRKFETIGGLWYNPEYVTYTRQSDLTWAADLAPVHKQESKVLDLLSLSSMPLACYTGYACTEERNARHDSNSNVYPLPEETTASTGLLGTIHNNTAIDMAPWESENEPDLVARTYDVTNMGFICAGHTSHSTDAGRVGRLCTGVTVRLSDASVQDQYVQIAANISGKPPVARSSSSEPRCLVFACGYYTYCTEAEADELWTEIISGSVGRQNAITCHRYKSAGLLVLSDTSGVVLRPDVTGKYGDTLCFNRTTRGTPQITTHRKPTSDVSALGFHFSAFFQLWPYIEYDRPPRPLLSSGQTLQAMALPWAANVSSVCPLKCEWPLVMTPLMQEIKLSYEKEGSREVACIPGGVNVSMCLANLANTYEDCIGVSRKAAEKGLFSHVDMCTLSLPHNTPVPPKGAEIKTADYPWWKCEDMCQHSSEGLACRCYKSQVRGVLHETVQEPDGSITVKAVRHARAVTGNKLATPHGQKGVMCIMEESEMPVGVLDDGSEVEFDVVMSLSSVVNRQTLGQYFEMVRGELVYKGLEKRNVVGATEREDRHLSCKLRIGGELVQRWVGFKDAGLQEDARVSYGRCYMFPMTQLTHDKQHYSHSTSGLSSLSPVVGRSRGGAVRLGEMESLAMAASGSLASLRELRDRGDMIVVDVCNSCNSVVGLCACTDSPTSRKMSLPSSTLAFSYSLACMYGKSLRISE